MSLDKAIRHAVEPVRRALWRTIRRGIVRLSDAAAMLQVEGYEGERTSDVEYWQHYGLASRPPAGIEALTLQVGGETEQPIAIATHETSARPSDLEDEEVALYGKDGEVRMRPDGAIDLIPGDVVNVGGDATACVDSIIRGETFNTSLAAMLGTLQSAMTSLGQSGAAAAIGTFVAQQSTWLSSKGKVE